MDKEIEVSIICTTYNHEKYIRDALESFIRQKTSFSFEILVHDDASTDHTPEIIREYEARFPDLIKPIYQKENQYSQHINISWTFQYPRAKGKYMALCEGDDYWIDDTKLQKQYEILETHPDINICTCKTLTVKEGKHIGYIAPADKDTLFTVEQVINGGGGFVGTNSIMFRKESFLNSFLYGKLMGLDYFTQIIASVPNGMYYLNDCMSTYRVAAVNSWSMKMKSDPNRRIQHIGSINHNLEILDELTSKRYHKVISYRILKNEVTVLMLQNDHKALKQKKYKKIYCSYPLKTRLKYRVKTLLQSLRSNNGN